MLEAGAVARELEPSAAYTRPVHAEPERAAGDDFALAWLRELASQEDPVAVVPPAGEDRPVMRTRVPTGPRLGAIRTSTGPLPREHASRGSASVSGRPGAGSGSGRAKAHSAAATAAVRGNREPTFAMIPLNR
jgi:hypothetical protein